MRWSARPYPHGSRLRAHTLAHRLLRAPHRPPLSTRVAHLAHSAVARLLDATPHARASQIAFPSLVERRQEQAWLACYGFSAERITPARAPDAFTTAVMARIAERAVLPPSTAIRPQLISGAGLRAVAGILLLSGGIALVSGCLFTLLAPTEALLVMGAAITACVTLFSLLHALIQMLISVASNDAVIIACAAVPAGVLLVWYRLLHQPTGNPSTLREA
ncbi:MAG TPA: hypothetical protein VFU88_21825 [Ktedonobacterales bacterium]|nr:hypothetical protein [Ktedonobacterales bacterium]